MNTKLRTRYFLLAAVVLLGVGSNFQRQTTTDLYQESYAAQMNKQIGYSSVNDLRAEQYREMYSHYDAHHNLVEPENLTKDQAAKKKEEMKKYTETTKPFFHAPVLQ